MTTALPQSGRALVLLLPVVLASGCPSVPHRSGDDPLPLPRIAWDPRSYVCYRATEAPVIDGRLDEEVWLQAPRSEPFVDIEGELRPSPEHLTRVTMLWDDAFFYVGAELEEPNLMGRLTERDSVIYRDDDLEIFIDPDGDTHDYFELEVNALGTVWDLLLERPYRDGGPARDAWDIDGLLCAVHLDGSLNAPGNIDRGWSVEIAIPWSALAQKANRAVPPRPGDAWRANFSRVDWVFEIKDGVSSKAQDRESGKELPERNWVWSPQGLVDMHYPEMWGFVQFSASAAGGVEERFSLLPVERAKWALRELYYAERHWFAEHGSFTTEFEPLKLATPEPNGFAWPPRMGGQFEYFSATLDGDDGTRVRIDQTGRVVVEDAPHPEAP